MRQTITLLLLLAASNLAIARNCPVTGKDLLGTWGAKSNAAFFEEFALELDSGKHVFNSWLHDRPGLVDAAWTFKDCQLTIIPQHDEFSPVHLKILSFKHGKLRVPDVDEPDHLESVYVRDPDGA